MKKRHPKRGGGEKSEKQTRAGKTPIANPETVAPMSNTKDVAENQAAVAPAQIVDETAPKLPTKGRTKKEDVTEAADKPTGNEGARSHELAPLLAAAPSGDTSAKETTAQTPTPSPTVTTATQPTNAEQAVSASLRLPSHLLGTSSARSTSTSPTTEVEPTRFLQRVARAFQAAQDRDGEVRIRLSPPELGALRLEVKVQDGVMTARMEAESPTAKALLIEHLPALRERLAEQGIRVEQFDIDLMNRQSGGNGAENMPRGDERQPQSPPSSRYGNERRNAPAAESPMPTRASRGSDGRLNVIV